MKKTRRILTLLLSLVLILSSVPALSLTAMAETETENETVTYTAVNTFSAFKTAIANGENVRLISNIICDETLMSGMVAELTDDIVIDGGGFSLLGVKVDLTGRSAHTGLFFDKINGGSVTIKNLTIKGEKNSDSEETYGNVQIKVPMSGWQFFGIICGNVVSGSFSLDNIDIYADIERTDTTEGGVAGVVGQVVATTAECSFTNCDFYGSVKNSANTGKAYAAAFVCAMGTGATHNVSFNNCMNNASVYGINCTAGFVGESKGASITLIGCTNNGDIVSNNNSRNGAYASGFVAYHSGKAFYAKNCVNNGAIGTIAKWGGAVIGLCNSETVTIENCINNGKITGASDIIGGIAGIVEPTTSTTSSTVTIKNCVNTADVYTGGKQTGGIVGCLYINTPASATVVFDACKNYGAVEAAWKAGCVGGMIGLAYSTKSGINIPVTNCVNTGSVTGDVYVGGIIGQSNIAGTTTFSDCINVGAVAYSAANEATDTGIGYIHGYANNNVIVSGSIYYGAEVEGAYSDGVTVYGISDTSNALAALNAKNNGYFYLSSGVLMYCATPAPQFVGVQDTALDETTGKYDVRFVAVIDNADLSIYKEVGFKVEATFSDASYKALDTTLPSTVVFTKLLANNGMKTYTAEELGGDYIIALSVENMDAYVTNAETGAIILDDNNETTDLAITFTVTPYAISTDGTYTFTGEAAQFVYTAGEFSQASAS